VPIKNVQQVEEAPAENSTENDAENNSKNEVENQSQNDEIDTDSNDDSLGHSPGHDDPEVQVLEADPASPLCHCMAPTARYPRTVQRACVACWCRGYNPGYTKVPLFINLYMLYSYFIYAGY
jgi:hypothetical protein